MKRKFIKTLIVMVLALSMVFCSVITAFALPINNIPDSYFYNVDGKDAAAPDAFTVERVITMNIADFSPADMHVYDGMIFIANSAGSRVHVLDAETFQPVCDPIGGHLKAAGDYKIPPLALAAEAPEEGEDGEDVSEDAGASTGTEQTGSYSNTSFNSPQGIFVVDSKQDLDGDGDTDPWLYVADTEGQRIVVCDMSGNVYNVYQSIKVPVLGDNYAFKPTRLVIDNVGDIQVVCSGINRGIMQITSDAEFRAFFGAPDVIIKLWDRIWRNFATEEQLAQMETFTPTEYSALAIDSRGFVYPTIAALDEDAVKALKALSVSPTYAPVKKLSADGTDMLRRKGLASPMGDLVWAPPIDAYPKLVDIIVDASFRYTVLDQETGRFFTYDADGNMLYIGGGAGTSLGTFQLATSIEAYGDFVFVGDGVNESITVFKATDYVKAINEAAQVSADGEWEDSIVAWKKVLSYNSNMYIANIGLGKAEMRLAMALIDDQKDKNGLNALDHYKKAIEYFDRANEKDNYAIAYTALRTNELEKYFGLIFGGIGILIVGLYVFSFIRKWKKKQKAKGATRPPKQQKTKKGDEK